MSDTVKGVMTKDGVKPIDYRALANLPTIDSVPADKSTNAIQSGAVYTALAGKLGTSAQAADSAKLGGVAASSYATKNDLTTLENTLNGSDTTINQSITNLQNGKAPNDHASTTTTYGVATASKYGHVKISDSATGGTASDVAASTKALAGLNTTMTDNFSHINIKSYTSVEQLGLTASRDSNGYLTSFPTVAEVCNKMPNYSVFIYITNNDNNNISSFWTLPNGKTMGYIEIVKIRDKRANLTFFSHDDRMTYVNTSRTDNVPDCKTWSRMLTTADFTLSGTTLTISLD